MLKQLVWETDRCTVKAELEEKTRLKVSYQMEENGPWTLSLLTDGRDFADLEKTIHTTMATMWQLLNGKRGTNSDVYYDMVQLVEKMCP